MKTYQELRKKEREKRINRMIEHEDLTETQEKTIKKWLNHLRATGKSIETILAYVARLSLFARETGLEYEDIDGDAITDYIAGMEKDDYAVSYINGFKVPISQFIKWHDDLELTDGMKQVLKRSRRTKQKTRSDALEKDEVKQLIASANNFRDRFIIAGLYETAMRKSEFLNLKIKDIKVLDTHAEITSVNGKTGYREMDIPLIMSYPDLLKHLESHPAGDNPDAPLIYAKENANTKTTRSLGNYGVNDLLNKYQKKSRLKKNVHPHILRHSRLTHLADEGWNEMDLRIYAGWGKSSQMAERYVHASGRRVKNSILQKEGITNGEAEEQAVKDKSLDPKVCARCDEINSPTNNFCDKCGMALDVQAAVQVAAKYERDSEVAMKTIEDNPELKKLFKETVKEMIKEEGRVF